MKNLIAIVAIALSLGACTEVYFEQSQPAGVKSQQIFPLDIQGTYLTDDNDTINIGKLSYQLENDKDESNHTKGKINDGVVLKKYKKNYFLNFKNEDGLWEVVALSKSNNDAFEALYIDGSVLEKMTEMKGITSVKEVKTNEGKIDYYVINPSKKELRKLLDQDVFTKVGSFRKVKL